LNGAFIPFPRTREEWERLHDPRPSIAERYSSREAYLEKASVAAQQLASERYLLREDVDPVVSHAAAVWDYVTTPAP
jgi:3-hydroxy-3-methylglutaryl CoA synthase